MGVIPEVCWNKFGKDCSIWDALWTLLSTYGLLSQSAHIPSSGTTENLQWPPILFWRYGSWTGSLGLLTFKEPTLPLLTYCTFMFERFYWRGHGFPQERTKPPFPQISNLWWVTYSENSCWSCGRWGEGQQVDHISLCLLSHFSQ